MRRAILAFFVAGGLLAGACGPDDPVLGEASQAENARTIRLGESGELAAVPDRLEFFSIPGVEHLEERVTLRTSGVRAVGIRSIAIKDEFYGPKGARHFEWRAQPHRLVTPLRPLAVYVLYKADTERDMGARLEIETDSLTQPVVRIALRGKRVSRPAVPRSWTPEIVNPRLR